MVDRKETREKERRQRKIRTTMMKKKKKKKKEEMALRFVASYCFTATGHRLLLFIPRQLDTCILFQLATFHHILVVDSVTAVWSVSFRRAV